MAKAIGKQKRGNRAFASSRFWCLLGRHAPIGHRADWNGEHYISRCEHCAKPIFRKSTNNWKIDRRRNRDLR